MGHDQPQSNIATDKFFAIAGVAAPPQLLIAQTIGPDCANSHMALSIHNRK